MSHHKEHSKYQCFVCQKSFSIENVSPLLLIRDSITSTIKEDFPNINSQDYICHDDLKKFRKKVLEKYINEDTANINSIENSVINSLEESSAISSNLNDDEDKRTFGEKVSDKIANFGGSWTFILIFIFSLTIWTLWNSLSSDIFDPYPFILLNLFLSMLAAIQAPIIMMSQNRQAARDRKRQEEDYKVNLKAELELKMLNEKMDKLTHLQWQRLLEIQEIQFELIEELRDKNKKNN